MRKTGIHMHAAPGYTAAECVKAVKGQGLDAICNGPASMEGC